MSTKFNMFDFYKNTTKKGLNTLFKLTISQEILVEIATNIQDNIRCGESVKGKMFAIFIELAQNIHIHSIEKQGEKNRGVGILSITEDPAYYLLSSGNKIKSSKTYKVLERCKHINTLDKEGLRDFYRSERTVSYHLRRTKGAYLGFIDMARRSQNPLKVQIDKIDEETSFLSITVKINKPVTVQTQQDEQSILSISI